NLDKVVGQLKGNGKRAALMTGAEGEVSNLELGFDNMITNETMPDAFNKYMKKLTGRFMHASDHSIGSLDIGYLSKVITSIHPIIGLHEPGLELHTKEYADKTVTKDGHKAIFDGALTLAATVYDILTDRALLSRIKAEFTKRLK